MSNQTKKNVIFGKVLCFFTHLTFRYTETEIESKVEELRQILCEKEGIVSKDSKDRKATYVHVQHVF